MSQAAVLSNGKTHAPPAPAATERLAVLHRQGERWRLLVAERRGTLAILEARTLAGEPWGSLAEARERHGFDRVVVVAPGRATVARCAGLPAGTSEEMGAAVALMGEAQLPESLPVHRRAAGVVPDVERPGLRTALMTGWKAEAQVLPGTMPEALEDLRITWTTPIAALAALRAEFGAALYADPHDGAVSMIAGGNEKTFARVLVEDAAAGFWRSVSQVAGETATAAGVAAPLIGSASVGPALRLDPRSVITLKEDVREMPDRAEWLNDYGIALGAALVATSADPLVRPLASMLESAPVVREPVLTRAVHWLSAPRHAWAVVGASVAVMLLSPLAFGAARVWLVNAKARGGADRLKAQGETARQQAMIEQLGNGRWPMTKLMADVSGSTPQGIIVETLRIATDQGVTIQGTAESAEQISAMQSNLNASKLFNNVKLNRIESTGSSVEFDIAADVVNPYFAAKPADDWAAKPLAVRLYGEGASNTAMPSGASRPSRSGGGETARENGGRRNRERTADSAGDSPSDGGRRNRERAERPSEASTKPAPVNAADAPKPITDEQIKALEMGAAMKEFVSRRTFSQKAGLEAATKTRLEDEVNRLKARLDQLRSGGGGAPAPGTTGTTGGKP